MTRARELKLGPNVRAGGCDFLVWAPRVESLAVRLHRTSRAAGDRTVEAERLDGREAGYWVAHAEGVGVGYRYSIVLDGDKVRPDPASRAQPEGVHGPSEIVREEFAWSSDAWRGVPLEKYVIYELHVGTFTPAGTFDGVIEHLAELRDLGVTAVELMPIAQFPGKRNWGYDGVCPFAAQNSYGGTDGLRRLVDAAHRHGLAVVLDVVYNHLGPEGNYLGDFGSYFTDCYKTPWGPALNFDGEHSDEVRRFFIESALHWVEACRVDALRLDAVHAIVDPSPIPFVRELCEHVHEVGLRTGAPRLCIAESAANDARLITPAERNGLAADAQWNDDFHHALQTIVTGEKRGYYASYGDIEHLERAYERGFVFTGEWSEFHKRRHGSPTDGLSGERFVVFGQNHDHVGNRPRGERLNALVTPAQARLVAAAYILSPFIPLLFMGEEYAEVAPFQYFVSHTDTTLVEAVRTGRAQELAAFAEAGGDVPDPQSEETFARSKLAHGLKQSGSHARMVAYYKELLRLRRETPALARLVKDDVETGREDRALWIRRKGQSESTHRAHGTQRAQGSGAGDVWIVMNCGNTTTSVRTPQGTWRLVLDSEDERWSGGAKSSERMQLASGEVRVYAWSCLVFVEGAE